MKGISLQSITEKLKSNPVGVAVLTGFEVAGTAVAFGVAETVLGVAAAYVAYQAIERGETPGGAAPEGAPSREALLDQLDAIEEEAAAVVASTAPATPASAPAALSSADTSSRGGERSSK
jgi:hypothetical protein